MRRWRKMTWAVAVWNTLMLAWIVSVIAAAASDGPAKDCEGLSQKACDDLGDAGAGIGVVLLGGLWFVGFVVLMLVWFASRPRQVIIVEDRSRAAEPPASV